MRLVQTLKQKPTVSPQLILANELLQLSSLELEQAIAQELAENPALELQEIQRCPECGARMADGVCSVCATIDDRMDADWRERDDADLSSEDYAQGSWSDPVSRLPSSTTLAEHLLHEASLCLEDGDVALARAIIGSIDERGLLSCTVDDLASGLEVERERVEEVLSVIQSLEPVGIAARDARECLLIQIADLGSKRRVGQTAVEWEVAERLIRDQWDRLGRSSLASLGEAVNATIEEVRAALHLIREGLNPFPAHTYWSGARGAPPKGKPNCPQPDVVIRESEVVPGEFEIELPKAGSFGLRVNASYRRAMDDLIEGDAASSSKGWELWGELCGRARLFVKSIEQRWETLHDLMSCLVDYQRDFLIHGERYLRPLTRAQVADQLGVHESTVSRAVNGKYVELPCGEIVSMDTFFDSAAPVKHLIEELIEQEETSLSDRAIAQRLRERGYDVARRTVAKYRNALKILPSSLRRWSRKI